MSWQHQGRKVFGARAEKAATARSPVTHVRPRTPDPVRVHREPTDVETLRPCAVEGIPGRSAVN